MDIKHFGTDVLCQDADAVRKYFHPNAWYNTNEHFTVEEFIRANCEYPGDGSGEVDKLITATHVHGKDGGVSCHATSFIHVVDGKIAYIDEYWGGDGNVPQWRKDKRIGTQIRL